MVVFAPASPWGWTVRGRPNAFSAQKNAVERMSPRRMPSSSLTFSGIYIASSGDERGGCEGQRKQLCSICPYLGERGVSERNTDVLCLAAMQSEPEILGLLSLRCVDPSKKPSLVMIAPEGRGVCVYGFND